MHARHLLLPCLLAALSSRALAADAELALIPLTVRVYDGAGLPESTRSQALDIAAGALAAADVDTLWRRCDAVWSATGCDAPPASHELVVRIVALPVTTSTRMTLGDATIDRASGSGRLATIYIDRVRALADAASVDAGRLLGYAIAHELGHLLLATTTHSAVGLMRAVWSDELLRTSRDADWRFTVREIAAIRARRMAHIVWGD